MHQLIYLSTTHCSSKSGWIADTMQWQMLRVSTFFSIHRRGCIVEGLHKRLSQVVEKECIDVWNKVVVIQREIRIKWMKFLLQIKCFLWCAYNGTNTPITTDSNTIITTNSTHTRNVNVRLLKQIIVPTNISNFHVRNNSEQSRQVWYIK